MDILFLLTGIICACIVPFLHYNFLLFKGTAYFLILIVFAFFVLAYAILSIFKFKIARVDYLLSKKIVSWQMESETKKASRVPYILSLFFGILLGAFLAIKSVDLLSNILLSLALAFTCLGWYLMGVKRYNNKIKETDSFLISHMGLIYNNKVYVFNGYSKGITGVKKENKELHLDLINGKKQSNIIIEIPDEKSAEVDAFLIDLKEYFNSDGDKE